MSLEQDCVLHTWTRQDDWNAPTITGGRGAWFWDADGKRYLDMSSQAECCNLGHQHPAVVKAIQEQAGKLCYISNGWGAEPRAELARRIVEIANAGSSFYGKVFFTCDGAEAVRRHQDGALVYRPAQDRGALPAYHGATHAAMSLGADARGRNTPDGLTGVARVLPPYCYRCPFGLAYGSCGIRCADHVEDVIQFEGPDTAAAVIAEPAAGTNGIAPPPEYWQRLREICDRYGILLIADEVMSGFGRTGAWFAWQRLGEFTAAPDLFVMAKGLTGAHIPLGAICVSAKVASHFDNHLLRPA